MVTFGQLHIILQLQIILLVATDHLNSVFLSKPFWEKVSPFMI